MKNLYGLLIAINKYPKRSHCLKGCENDRRHFQEYLEKSYSNRYHLHLKSLINENATRDNIIEGFKLFEEAKEGDVCVLFYAGHGSQIAAPEAFEHLASNQHLQTIVCYDSRTPGGRDLVDKELSYLIWNAINGKNVHFVAIMDCCHSGSNTRDEEELNIVARRVENREEMPLEELLGYEHYQHGERGSLTPPRARHILLSAAQSHQTAKEVEAYNLTRGVFSFSLMEALESAGQALSYGELINRVSMRIRGLVRKQSPRLDADEAEDKDTLFLTQEKKERNSVFFISYDYHHGWIASAGATYGVSNNLAKYQPHFQIVHSGKMVRVTEVQASFSKVADMQSMNTKQRFEAILVQQPISVMNFAFAPNVESEGQVILTKAYEEIQPELFTLTPAASSPKDLLIYALEEKWSLTLPYSKRPLFQRVGPFTETAALDFLKKLASVAKWHQILRLTGPSGIVHRNEFEIHLEQITEIGKYTYDAGAKEVPWWETLNLDYQKDQGEWYRPAFRLKVKNTSHRKLWASVLYMEDNFAISNELLPIVELAPGQESWLEDRTGQFPTNAIQVWMHPIYQQWKISNILEYLKVIISTVPFQTDDLNQPGLPYEGPIKDQRGYGHPPEVVKAGWTARTIELNVHKPWEAD